MEKSQLEVRQTSDGLVCALYFDKRYVLMLTNIHDPPEQGLYKFEIAPNRWQPVKPPLIHDYNKNMGFVDKSDQMMTTHSLHRRTNKWTKKLFFHFLDTTVLNSYILYKPENGTKKPLSDFRLKLVQGLILRSGPNEQIVRSPTIRETTRLSARNSNHWPKQSNTRRRCVVCRKAGKEKRSTIYCSGCDVGLCLDPCFQRYHTILHY